MPKESFTFRLVFDRDFYEITIKQHTKENPTDKPSLLTKLMYINAKSKDHTRQHNVISKKMFNKILEDNKSMCRDLLRASFYDIDEPEIECIEDEKERVVKYAIDLASTVPFKSIILTTPEKEEEYLENEHYKNVKEITVKSGDEAIRLINSFWERCC
ncbi:hypothetical protein KY366_05380 [Candidatus Woesearchaeota archaeon]|nr:hypothetical protein [Candidatus Woesearchaeota archaeon]